LPFPQPDRLVLLWGSKPAQDWPQLPLSQPNYADLRDRSRTFERLASSTLLPVSLTGRGEPAQIHAALLDADLFPALGIRRSLPGSRHRRVAGPVVRAD